MAWKFGLEKEAEIFALLFEDKILRTDFLRTDFLRTDFLRTDFLRTNFEDELLTRPKWF